MLKKQKTNIAQLITQVRLARVRLGQLSRRIEERIARYPDSQAFTKEKTLLGKFKRNMDMLTAILEILEIRLETIAVTSTFMETIYPVVEVVRQTKMWDVLKLPEVSTLLEPIYEWAWSVDIPPAIRNSPEVDKILREAESVIQAKSENLNS